MGEALKQEMTQQEIKQVLLDSLKKIDAVCQAQGITYYLAYGTLLGAVRHKGMIPWDDDIDIWVPIEQFHQLICALKELNGYYVLDYQDGTFWLYFSKFCDKRTLIVEKDPHEDSPRYGVSIDIFPLFGIHGGAKRYRYISKMLNALWYYNNGYHLRSSKQIVAVLSHMVGQNELQWRRRLLAYQKSAMNTKMLGTLSLIYGGKDQYSKDCFCLARTEFEGDLYPIPKGYDQILSKLYGNYMELPPVEERKKAHDVKAYWTVELD